MFVMTYVLLYIVHANMGMFLRIAALSQTPALLVGHALCSKDKLEFGKYFHICRSDYVSTWCCEQM